MVSNSFVGFVAAIETNVQYQYWFQTSSQPAVVKKINTNAFWNVMSQSAADSQHLLMKLSKLRPG